MWYLCIVEKYLHSSKIFCFSLKLICIFVSVLADPHACFHPEFSLLLVLSPCDTYYLKNFAKDHGWRDGSLIKNHLLLSQRTNVCFQAHLGKLNTHGIYSHMNIKKILVRLYHTPFYRSTDDKHMERCSPT